MIIEEKLRILAKFFAKTRMQGDPYLERLFTLEDEWNVCYAENRIRLGFDAAQILANEVVLIKVLSEDYN